MDAKKPKCSVCGGKVPVFNLDLGQNFKSRVIELEMCFSCQKKIKEEQAKEQDEINVQSSLRSSCIPLSIMKILASEYTLTKGQGAAFKKTNKDMWCMPSPYLWGPVGCGKTFLACKLAYNYILETGMEIRFVSISSIISSKFSNIKEDPTEVKFPLILDDLGNHTLNQKIVSFLLNLVNYRINSNLPTIITCNTDPITLGDRLTHAIGSSEEYLAESLSDRLLELCQPIKVVGRSIRTQKFLESNG